jgi:flagellar export protein FliJ
MQAVLDQRERIETVAKQSFAEAETALRRGETLLAELEEVRSELLNELCRRQREGFDHNEMQVYHDYLQTVVNGIREQENYIRDLAILRQAKQLALVGAAQNRQALAGVKDRHQQAYTAQRARAEQKMIDELATVRHAYGQRER